MDIEAIRQAEQRLVKARTSLADMRAAHDAESIENHWVDFIHSISSFYSKLEQGSKNNNRSSAWFGHKKGQRRSDPLISYVHQARNADEHGIKRITKHTNSHVTLAPGASAVFTARENEWDVTASSGDILYPLDVAVLVPVFDGRSDKWFAPPQCHLGKTMSSIDATPIGVAILMLSYIEEMLIEAKALTK